MKIAIVADYDLTFPPHVKTNEALKHTAKSLKTDIESRWISTAQIVLPSGIEMLHTFDGLLIGPGSPYKSMEGALAAIRFTRENQIPLKATCGGFQHVIIEYARNVLGIQDAQHAEYTPHASNLFVSVLACSLTGRTMSISLKPDSLAARLYGSESVKEQYYCNFGVNPEKVSALASGPLRIVGSDPEGEIRVVELQDHPFFIATLFVPQLSSSESKPHPLINGFIRAASKAENHSPYMTIRQEQILWHD